VFVAATVDEAMDAARLIMKERAFGDAGNRVVVEECIEGEEASFMVFTDGCTIVPMVSSQDHKRVFDGDRGSRMGDRNNLIITNRYRGGKWNPPKPMTCSSMGK
jgi:phosphoribosylamine--glycine ligase